MEYPGMTKTTVKLNKAQTIKGFFILIIKTPNDAPIAAKKLAIGADNPVNLLSCKRAFLPEQVCNLLRNV
jgi:hypothetical protein